MYFKFAVEAYRDFIVVLVLPGLAWVGVCAKMVIQRGDDHGRYRAVSVFIRFEVPVEC